MTGIEIKCCDEEQKEAIITFLADGICMGTKLNIEETIKHLEKEIVWEVKEVKEVKG